MDGLAELPIGNGSGAAEGIEPFLGALGGMVTTSFGPRFRPADVVIVGSGLDGDHLELLDEFQTGRGGRKVIRLLLGRIRHG